MRLPAAALLLLALSASACGPAVPPRYVVERDIGELQYRRYQEVLDVEFPIPGNSATGHTATYVRRGATQGPIAFSTAFVTVYEHAASVTAEVRERLDELASYEVSVTKLEGEWMWILEGSERSWALWVSGRYLVKLSGDHERDEDDGYHGIDEALLEAFTNTYPSDLDEHGQAREGSDSYGQSQVQAEEEQELEMPSSLREDAPI